MENSTKPKLKIVPRLILFLVIGLLALWTFNRFMRESQGSLFMKASSEKKFMSALDEDLVHLKKNKILPTGFDDLKKVDLVTDSKSLRHAFNRYPIGLHNSKDGKYNLEIFADTIEEGGVVIQYDLVEIKSGNTIWEMGRTFPHSL